MEKEKNKIAFSTTGSEATTIGIGVNAGKLVNINQKTKVMENKIKEIERLMMVHDDLEEKKKKIERMIKENLDKIQVLTKSKEY